MKKYYEISIENLIIDDLLRINLKQKVLHKITTKLYVKLSVLKDLNYHI